MSGLMTLLLAASALLLALSVWLFVLSRRARRKRDADLLMLGALSLLPAVLAGDVAVWMLVLA